MAAGYDISASASLSSSAANTAGIRGTIGPVQFGQVNFGQSNTSSMLTIAVVLAGVIGLAWLYFLKK